MIELNFLPFLKVAFISCFGILVLDILWLILRASWKWIDDGKRIKWKSIAWFVVEKKMGMDDIIDCGGPLAWIILAVTTFGLVIFIYLFISFYYISIAIGILIIIAHLTRFTKRLSKKLKTHTDNLKAHKG